MDSIYKRAFDAVGPDEQKKQETVSRLLQYMSGAQTGIAKKEKKPFVWTSKRVAAAASSAAALIFCAVLLPVLILGPFSGGKSKRIKDYYEEYSFELPFEHTVGNNQYTLLYFNSELTAEQMCGEINNAGFTASLYDYGGYQRIFITAAQDGFLYYFVIYGKEYQGGVFVLSACSAGFDTSVNSELKTPHYYSFLFPNHYAGEWTDDRNVKIYCTFDEFAQFYTATGKNDAQIDAQSKTVTFFCEGSEDYNWIRGNIILHYTETETGNYISIQPL